MKKKITIILRTAHESNKLSKIQFEEELSKQLGGLTEEMMKKLNTV